jgi:hypothetical protein
LSFPLLILTLTGGFIDDETPIASGLGTYQHKTWNALENGNGNEDWEASFAGIYKQSRSTRLNVADSHNCVQSLPGVEEFPLWCIGCRVCYYSKSKKKEILSSLLGRP